MNKIDISTLLASLIHESKNTVGNVMFQLQSFKTSFSSTNNDLSEITRIEGELKRLNDQWVEYLYLYKLASDGYDLQCETWQVDEFLDDQIFVLNQSAVDKNITLQYQCEQELLATFDEKILTSVISTGFYNALRFAKNSIVFKGEAKGDFVVLSIEDDGPGFFSEELSEEDEFLSNYNTSLGLYFAELCAQAHTNIN